MSIIERAVRRLRADDEPVGPRPVEIVEEPRRARTRLAPTPARPTDAPPKRRPSPPAQKGATSPAQKGATSPAQKGATKGPSDTIDLKRLESAGMIVPNGKRTQISEEFRVIKRPLLQNAKQTDPGAPHASNLILVTSAFPDEGKTFSSINLAISMSLELDHSVLLVDADVAQPHPGDFLGLKPRKGLMDLLLDPTLPLSETLIRTNVDRLDVLLAGRRHDHATELLASDGMTRLLDELAAQGPERIVIFDAPPLLVTTEASALAHRAGQVVLVVAAGETTHTAVKSAMAQLEGCRVFGLLNKGTAGLDQDAFNYSRYRYSES